MLPQSQRLRNRRDFRYVYSRGRSFVSPALVLYVRRTKGNEQRIGFSVSKKVGGAVERNRVKRRLREVCRALLPHLSTGFDVVLVARVRVKELPFSDLVEVVSDLFKRAKLLNEQAAPERPPCGDSAN